MSVRSSGAEFGSICIRTQLFSAGASLSWGDVGELHLIAVRQGGLSLVSPIGGRALRAGEAVLSLAEVFCEADARTGAEVVTISGPGELARDVRSTLSACAPQALSAGSALLAPSLAFALRAAQTPEATRSRLGDYYVERLLQEMLQGLLADTSRVERTPRPLKDPFRQAVSVLAAQFTDPDLASAGVAEAVNLSRRQLEREFSRRGTTIRRELRRIRVERAVKMLRDPDYALLTVGQVARHVGFSGASSLARAMAQEGYDSPSKLRGSGPTPRGAEGVAIPNAP
ncbi:helix-turn-helix domain-containing protein [Leucobacter sp. wl10]|uniref:helix-turn-helix domain-containing protein n=1 Tax=Leucobacter sp. wl10 TaxID=2304677 RepID=UPI0013C2A8D6|nr:helix-turn-helix domain-containing protein [Leucobacter sp. wl10]